MPDTHACKCNTDNWPKIRSVSEAALNPAVVEYIAQCRQESHPESQLISVLHRVQEHFGYLGKAQLDAVAQLLQVPSAKVTGVASFYHFFRLQPQGTYSIRVCLGTACYVKGADRLAQKLKEELGINFGETSRDGVFSLEASRCLGTCGLAPIIMVGDDVYGQVTPDRIPAILEKYMDLARK